MFPHIPGLSFINCQSRPMVTFVALILNSIRTPNTVVAQNCEVEKTRLENINKIQNKTNYIFSFING